MHSTSFDLVTNKSVDSNYESLLENAINEDTFEFNKGEDVFSSEDDIGQFSLEEDVIINTCKKKFENLFSKVQCD